MKRTHWIAVLSAAILLTAGTTMKKQSTAAPSEAAMTNGEADAPKKAASRQPDRVILYKTTAEGKLNIHIYFPADWKATDRRPALVLFHGGGWAGGTPNQFYAMCEYFAGRGMVMLTAEYRLFNTHQTTPLESVRDACSAMRFVRGHAGELGIDPDKLLAGGGSAGGHLAACTALCDEYEESDDLSISCRPAALVMCNPVLNTSSPEVAKFFRSIEPARREEVGKKICPLQHLTNTCPPAITFYGTEDKLLPPCRVFIEKSSTLGNRIEFWTAEGQAHGFFNRSPWQEAVTEAADRFLSSLGYISGPPTIRTDPKAVLKKETVLTAD